MEMQHVDSEWAMPDWGKFPAGFHNRVQTIMTKLGLPRMGQNYVFRALANPSRRTKSGVANVSGNYPSQKMGMSIGFESRTLEYSRIIHNEADPKVLGYVAQLPQLKISYKCGRTGRKISYLTKPDLLEIYENEIVVVECKPITVLREWAVDRPGFVIQGNDNKWRCPPAEEACSALGLKHRIICEQNLPPRRIKNLGVLIDYIHTGYSHGRDEAISHIVRLLDDERRLSIEELLLELSNVVTVDDIYRSIATGLAVVDLDDCSIIDHQRTFMYASQAAMDAYKISAGAISRASTWLRGSILDLKPGTLLNWNGRTWHLVNMGVTQITLHNGVQLQELDRPVFDKLLRDCTIVMAEGGESQSDFKSNQSNQMLRTASPNDLTRALKVYKQILPHLQRTAEAPPDRTARRNLCKWKRAEAGLGNGFVGLLRHFSRSGNRESRIESAVMSIVRKQTKDHYATTKKSRKIHVHERIVAECERSSLPAPSYAWYCHFIKRLPAFELLKSREGRKAAYRLEPRQENDGSLTDARAEAAWMKAYLDHTEIELETRCSTTSVLLGRPWLSTLVDDNSSDILAWFLTWDPPSYRSVMMVMRDCVERHGRLPDEIVVDGGKDMASEWFEVSCAFYCVTITRRPAGKARFGSRGERAFGTIDTTFLSNCLGNTQLRKNVRQMTPEVDPNHKAVWTMGALLDAFEIYFDHYRNLVHRELLVCPRVARERSVLAGSGRAERRIIYDRNFLINTCPTTRTGQAKVQPDGVKINYLYYSTPALRLAYGKKVPVRFEPYDMSIAYVLIEGKWIELTSRFANALKGRTERELRLARDEYFRHRGLVEKQRLTEKTFINFLEYLDRTEEMLIDHHRSIEMRRATGVAVNGELDEIDGDAEVDGISESLPSTSLPQPMSPFRFAGMEIETLEVE
ncbi:MAG: transposase family protein [Burkholderiaceae bacterium]|nr:transposase family protein [Burkholderiaceae bacterium]